MAGLPNLAFFILLCLGIGLFVKNVRKIRAGIRLGRPLPPIRDKAQRLKNMLRLALGQSKMTTRPMAGILHFLVYVGFILVNVELVEIFLDGLLGTHRIFAVAGGRLYNFLIFGFEVLALLVIAAVIIFWIRRNLLNISRFKKPELKGFPRRDAHTVLYLEFILMSLFLTMNACDYLLQLRAVEPYKIAGAFPVSAYWAGGFSGLSDNALIVLERSAWWLHYIGILVFLNYLYYSKHLHIILAFPNTYYANPAPRGDFGTIPSITREVKAMLGLPENSEEVPAPSKFGASDVADLSRLQLLNAYTCTECGRCTDECPANKTGKKLSPRKIMMDVRDRIEELSAGKGADKLLLGDYVSPEEIWACTTCNACVEACPLSINPMSVIIDLRQFLVMEQSKAPVELNQMMANIENNGAPWHYNAEDRLRWANE